MEPCYLPAVTQQAIRSYFATPVKVAANGAVHDIATSSLRECEVKALASLVYKLQPKDSLEIGLAAGGSCIAIASSRENILGMHRHVALDPFQDTHAHGIGLAELERLGLLNAVEWLPDRSENYLNAAWAIGAIFDFVFVDGGHDIGQKLTDSFYISKTLRPGGVVVFHDALFFSTAIAVRFFVRELGYEIITLPTDSKFRQVIRSFRHASRLGVWYASKVIPKLCRSLVALRKPLI